MAKKSKVEQPQELEDVVLQEFENVITKGADFVQKNLLTIPVSPIIDTLLTGGIPEGSFVTLTGAPKIGKTLTALDFLATCQNSKYNGELAPNGRKIFIYNIEGRLKKRDLMGIHHLNVDDLNIIESTPGKILSAQQYLEIADKLINTYPGSVHLLDSLSALCSEEERAEDMSKMFRADAPKLLAKFCRKVANVIPVNRNIVIGITHIMANPSGYGASTQEKSGFAIKYALDVKLHAKSMEPWIIGTGKEQVGQIVEWHCLSSGIGPPGRKDKSYVRYGYGIDKDMEIITLAESLNLVTKKAAWYKFTFLEGEGVNVCGKEALSQLIKDNKDIRQQLITKIKEYMVIEWVE